MEIQDSYLATELVKEKAQESWSNYCELIKRDPREQYKILKRAYYELKQGHTIIDIYKAFEITGTFPDGYPRLAIAKADLDKVMFKGSGWNRRAGGFYKSRDAVHAQILIPSLTQKWIDWRETLVPSIPPEFYPENNLNRYYILWEVEQGGWKQIPAPPGDPLLLKRISKNLFAVMAAWELTDLEKAALKSALL